MLPLPLWGLLGTHLGTHLGTPLDIHLAIHDDDRLLDAIVKDIKTKIASQSWSVAQQRLSWAHHPKFAQDLDRRNGFIHSALLSFHKSLKSAREVRAYVCA